MTAALGAASLLVLTACGGGDSTDAKPKDWATATSQTATAGQSTPPSKAASTKPSATTSSTTASKSAQPQSTVTATKKAPSTAKTSSAPSPSASSSCGSYNHEAEVAKGWATLDKRDDGMWDQRKIDDDAWDACLPLSYVQVRAADLVSSAQQVMLFHNGKFLGTATLNPQGRTGVHRVSPSEIKAIYRYALPDESEMQATGEKTATYAWDEAGQKVVMSGSVPYP